jgi:hypothetical protein
MWTPAGLPSHVLLITVSREPPPPPEPFPPAGRLPDETAIVRPTPPADHEAESTKKD